jgi:hypothetical protein
MREKRRPTKARSERERGRGRAAWWSSTWVRATAALSALALIVAGWLVNEYLAGTVEAIRGHPPLIVTPSYDDDAYSDGFLLIASQRDKVGEAIGGVDDCRSLLRRARAAGAVHSSPLFLHLLVEGNTLKDVTIVSIRARVVRRGPDLRGAAITCAGGGEISPVRLTFDLDRSDGVALRVRGDGKTVGPYFGQGYAISVRKGEVVPLLVTAETKNSFVAWKISIDLVIDGKRRSVIVDDDGQPFRVTAPRCGGNVYAPEYEWAWFRHPPRLITHPRASYNC